MSKIYLITVVLVFCAGENDLNPVESLPSWITNNDGFTNPTKINSIHNGNGSIYVEVNGNKGWLVSVNEKAGHGIEMELNKLSLNPNLNDFLLISPWPLTGDFKQIKLFTGKFMEPLNKLRIPNTKTFFILYSASPTTRAPEMDLFYRRYGISLEGSNFPTESPTKKKETVFEVQLKGKEPAEYAKADFLKQVKEGIRAAAKQYCSVHNITFNDQTKTEEMVLLHRIAFCPFEWPDRDICVSIKHSVFVSGVRIPDEQIILNYQLTSEHLKKMWNEQDFPELQEIGITVFHLPPTYSVIGYWILIIGLTIICSIIIAFISWKTSRPHETREDTTPLELVKEVKKPKPNLAKHQRIPSFMYKKPAESQVAKIKEFELSPDNENGRFENAFKPGESSELPFKNYFGGFLFGANRAFEDDEDKAPETHMTPCVVKIFRKIEPTWK